jgi:Flp pilus assembly protein TadD
MSREGGDLPGAEGYWEAALASDSTHAPSHGDLGVLRLIQGDTVSAVAHLQAAVQLEPGMARAWFALGRVFFAQGRTDDARRALGAFIETAGNQFPDQRAWAREALSRISRD